MEALEQRVLETVRQQHMIETGQHVVVGFSGGADSTCLLLVLAALQTTLGCTISAVHVHHGLRESADHDEAFCRQLCERQGIALMVVHANAAEYAALHGESLEEAGRAIRYTAFREELTRHGGGRIATAHHREDVAETVLWNLCRGSGIAGLGGIRPVMGEVIRPLLDASRAEIEAYLTGRGISWCSDETNQDTAITRNYLRLTAIPELTANVNHGTMDHLVRLAGEARETEAYLQEETAAALQRCRKADIEAREGEPCKERGAAISVAALRREPTILQKRILRHLLITAAGRSKDIAAVHVQAILAICQGSHGTVRVDLPYGLRAVRCYDVLAIRETQRLADGSVTGSSLTGGEGAYRMRVFCLADTDEAIPCGEYTKWFDYDRIGTFPIMRTRRAGDRITIGGGRHKSLHRFMIDEKIPRELRDGMELPFAGDEVLWIPGHPMNAAFKVQDDTERILEIAYCRSRASSDGAAGETGDRPQNT